MTAPKPKKTVRPDIPLRVETLQQLSDRLQTEKQETLAVQVAVVENAALASERTSVEDLLSEGIMKPIPAGTTWTPEAMAKLTSIPPGVLFGVSPIFLGYPEQGSRRGRRAYLGPQWAGMGASGCHPQSPNHFLAVVEGTNTGNGFPSYCSVDTVLKGERGFAKHQTDAALAALKWETPDAWKADGKLLPLDHPIVEAWVLGDVSHCRGGEFLPRVRQEIGFYYGEEGTARFDASPVVKLLSQPSQELYHLNQFNLIGAVSGASEAQLEKLAGLQFADNVLRNGTPGEINALLPALSEDFGVQVAISEDRRDLVVNGEAFPFRANWTKAYGPGVTAAVQAIGKQYLKNHGLEPQPF